MLGRPKTWLGLTNLDRTCLDEVQRWHNTVESRTTIVNVTSSMLDIGAQFMRLRERRLVMQGIGTNPSFVEYALKFEEVAEGN